MELVIEKQEIFKEIGCEKQLACLTGLVYPSYSVKGIFVHVAFCFIYQYFLG
jgi:hypothetical protein